MSAVCAHTCGLHAVVAGAGLAPGAVGPGGVSDRMRARAGACMHKNDPLRLLAMTACRDVDCDGVVHDAHLLGCLSGRRFADYARAILAADCDERGGHHHMVQQQQSQRINLRIHAPP